MGSVLVPSSHGTWFFNGTRWPETNTLKRFLCNMVWPAARFLGKWNSQTPLWFYWWYWKKLPFFFWFSSLMIINSKFKCETQVYFPIIGIFFYTYKDFLFFHLIFLKYVFIQNYCSDLWKSLCPRVFLTLQHCSFICPVCFHCRGQRVTYSAHVSGGIFGDVGCVLMKDD